MPILKLLNISSRLSLIFASIIIVALESISVALVVPLIQLQPIITKFLTENIPFAAKMNFSVIVMLIVIATYVLKSGVILYLYKFQIKTLYKFQKTLSDILVFNAQQKSFATGLTIEQKSNLVRDCILELGKFTHGWMIPVITLVSETILFLIMVLILFIYQGSLIIKILPFVALLLVVYLYFITPYLANLGKERVQMDQMRVEKLQDYLGSLQELKNLQGTNPILNEYHEGTSKSFSADATIVILQYLPRIVIEILVIIVIALAIVETDLNNLDSAGAATLAISGLAGLRLLPSVNKIINMAQALRSHSYLVNDLSNKLTAKYQQPKVIVPVLGETVKIENLELYNGKKHIKIDAWTLRKGTMNVLVGSSGIGKSSILQGILGNAFAINGHFIIGKNTYNFDTYCIAGWLASQKPYVFKGTLDQNINLFKNKSNIGTVSNFLDDIPLALNETVEQDKLSGGQIQRIGIMRAIQSNTDLVIFDEPTNNLDSANKIFFEKIINKLKSQGKIILIVTHDQHVIANSDSVYHVS